MHFKIKCPGRLIDHLRYIVRIVKFCAQLLTFWCFYYTVECVMRNQKGATKMAEIDKKNNGVIEICTRPKQWWWPQTMNIFTLNFCLNYLRLLIALNLFNCPVI